MTLTDWIQAISAAVVGVVTIFLWLLARQQTRLLGASVELARASAEAARKSAEVAERALVGVQRPLLRLSMSDLETAPYESDPNLTRFATTVRIENFGREPAFVVDCVAQLLPETPRTAPPLPGVRPFDPVWSMDGLDEGAVIAPGASMTFEVERLMDAREDHRLEAFNFIHGVLFLYGLLTYEDPIGTRREIGFTFGFDPTEVAFVRCSLDGCNFDRTADRDLDTPWRDLMIARP